MNTAKQVNIIIGLLFLGLVGTLLYFIWENGYDMLGVQIIGREAAARERQEMVNAERGGHLFALNCRSCHGLKGGGALERAGLPGAPLNLPENRSPELAGGALEQRRQRFHDTIVCGRVGTVMPPWSTTQGGPLNDFQIQQLVLLITSEFSPEAWEFALKEANRTDQFDLRRHLTVALGKSDDTIEMNTVAGVKPSSEESQVIVRIGGDTMEQPYELLEVVGVDEGANTLQVERGVEGTDALDHAAESEVYEGPVAPGTTITGNPEAQGFPPCGQRPAQVQETGAAEAVALADGATIEIGDNFFQADGQRNPTLQVAVDRAITINLANRGGAVHNLRIAGTDGEFSTIDDLVSDPDLLPGGSDGTIGIELSAGSYNYQCEFHPTEMAGQIVAQ